MFTLPVVVVVVIGDLFYLKKKKEKSNINWYLFDDLYKWKSNFLLKKETNGKKKTHLVF